MPTSRASAVWQGGLASGSGRYHAASGAFEGAYSVPTRFEGATGTNPEELIAAAHAACLSMALAAGLEQGGAPPEEITTEAACTIEKLGTGWTITTLTLDVRGRVPGIDQTKFEEAAAGAKANCPVSKALAGNVVVTVNATLET